MGARKKEGRDRSRLLVVQNAGLASRKAWGIKRGVKKKWLPEGKELGKKLTLFFIKIEGLPLKRPRRDR